MLPLVRIIIPPILVNWWAQTQFCPYEALFVLLCGLTGSFAALNLGFMTSGLAILQGKHQARARAGLTILTAPLEALDIYLAAVSIINVIFIVPV